MANESRSTRNGTSTSASQDDQALERKRKRLSEVFEKQDRRDVSRLAAGFRDLIAQADENKTNLANTTIEELTKTLRQQGKLFKQSKDTSLSTLDAKLLQTTSETAVGLARQIGQAGSSFDIDDFLIRVSGVLGLDRVEVEDLDLDDEQDELEDSLERAPAGGRKGRLGDWEKIGWMAARYTRRVPGVEFMYGPLAVEHKKRQVARRQRNRSPVQEIRPQQIETQSQKATKDDTVSNVLKIAKILRRHDTDGNGMNFFKLVINPDDFGQTVENIFYVSFLIKDGNAGIDVNDDGEVIIRYEVPDGGDADGGGRGKNQAVIELDMDTWQEAKEVFGITESIIPHRIYTHRGRPPPDGWNMRGIL